jgi:hypothetical protein
MKLPKFYIGQTILIGEYQFVITDAKYDEHDKWVYYHNDVPYEEHQVDAWVESGVWKTKPGEFRVRTT